MTAIVMDPLASTVTTSGPNHRPRRRTPRLAITG